MPYLLDLQRDFRNFALGHGSHNFLRHVKPSSRISEDMALKIHHNNIFSTHIQALKNHYPLVFSLMGFSQACELGHAYLEVNFPCDGNLENWGGGFSAFIQSSDRARPWPYLKDIARYEWARKIACQAQEDPLLTPENMNSLVTCKPENLRFPFQKSCQLMAFSYPLEKILKSHHQSVGGEYTEESSYALILKHQAMIKVYWLTPSLFVFLNRLKEAQDVEVAFAAAQVLEQDFDLQAAFGFLLSNPILCAS